MRRKAGHSMMRRAPSTPLSEGLPTWTVLMNRHEVRRRRPAHPRKPRDRTSRPESQASERHRSRSACSGTQHHPPCRSSDGQRPADRTMDATDTKARESRSRGCYQAALYNDIRTHRSLDKDAPAVRPVTAVLAAIAARRLDVARYTVAQLMKEMSLQGRSGASICA